MEDDLIDDPFGWVAHERAIEALSVFPTHLRNCLVRLGIRAPDQLATWDDAAILKIRGIGIARLAEIRARVPRETTRRP